MTKLMDITFGDWLLARMRERSLSQSEFSRRAGLTRQAISYYTTGKSKQPDEFALKNQDNTAARRRLQAEDFNLTLQQTRVILHHLPQWFATEDPRIVNTLLHRLCTRIYITPDNTALPEFRTP